MKEVGEKKFAGPYFEPPFKFFIQSPISLVPKDGGSQTRLIFHLSHPKARPVQSVNGNIPAELCTVQYKNLDMAILRCLEEGIACSISKSDMKSAFRHICIRVKDFCLLVMVCESPFDGKMYYFVDKCLGFGCAISCKLFQEFSNCIAHLVQYRTHKVPINYLDDYLFAHYLRQLCNHQVATFIAICGEINFPVALEKTYWATHLLTFLGFLINTIEQTVSVPIDKIEKTKLLISKHLPKRKITVLALEELTGLLNFLCRAIVPGRAFTRRLYMEFSSAMKPHYHVNLTWDMKQDLSMWLQFLEHPSVYSRPFMDFSTSLVADKINMYSDASGVISFWSTLPGLMVNGSLAQKTSWKSAIPVLSTKSFLPWLQVC